MDRAALGVAALSLAFLGWTLGACTAPAVRAPPPGNAPAAPAPAAASGSPPQSSASLAASGSPPASSSAASPAASASPTASASAGSAAPPPPGTSAQCGKIECRIFDSARDAFAAVLAKDPLVLGVGEAHALRGTESIEPSVRRFTRELLPALSGRATDLVVELLLPNRACEKETRAAKEEQKAVTEKQAPTNQNDYVTLANTARSLGIRPHALTPTCDDLRRIGAAGPDAAAVSLDVVTRLASDELARGAAENERRGGSGLVVAYGGAMHNDLVPRPGREGWSFGPLFNTRTGGRYVELDLFVPEFVSGTPAWRSLPWVQAFDPAVHDDRVRLLEPSPGAFVLIFPRTVSAVK